MQTKPLTNSNIITETNGLLRVTSTATTHKKYAHKITWSYNKHHSVIQNNPLDL